MGILRGIMISILQGRKICGFSAPAFSPEGAPSVNSISALPYHGLFCAQMPLAVTTLSVKRRLERSAERDKREYKNNISAEYSQSKAEAILNSLPLQKGGSGGRESKSQNLYTFCRNYVILNSDLIFARPAGFLR